MVIMAKLAMVLALAAAAPLASLAAMSCVATLYENGVPGGVGSSFSVSLLLPDGATGPLVSDVKDLAISKANFDDKARSMTVACECDGACLDFTLVQVRIFSAPSWRKIPEGTNRIRMLSCTAVAPGTTCKGTLTGLDKTASAIALLYNFPDYSLYLKPAGPTTTSTPRPTPAPKPPPSPKPTPAPRPTTAPKPPPSPKPTPAPRPTTAPKPTPSPKRTPAPRPTSAPRPARHLQAKAGKHAGRFPGKVHRTRTPKVHPTRVPKANGPKPSRVPKASGPKPSRAPKPARNLLAKAGKFGGKFAGKFAGKVHPTRTPKVRPTRMPEASGPKHGGKRGPN